MAPSMSAPESSSGVSLPVEQQPNVRLLAGSLWMIGARWAMRLIGLASTLLLARLLSPADFGLVAMVMLAYGLLETISYAGVDLALMRDGAGSREHFDTAWTVQVLQGLFIAALLLLVSPLAASYFGEPRVVELSVWVALRAVIDGLQNIGVVAFRRELDFAREFRFTVYTKLAGFVMVVAAAFWFRNYWALIVGSLAAAGAQVAASYAMHPYRPRLTLAKVAEIWSFSQWLMISRIGSFLNRKCDEFVVGGQVGTAAMGTYHVANDLATLPTSEVVMPVRRSLFPSLSRLTGQPDDYQRAVLLSYSAVAVLCLFVATVLVVAAPEVVAIVLGAKWAGAVDILRLLAVFGALSALVLVLEVPIWVSGRTKVSAFQSWLELALLAPLAWVAVRAHGAEGAATARVAVALVMVPLMMGLAARVGAGTFALLWSALWRPTAAALVTAAATWSLTVPGAPALVALIVKLLACGMMFLATLGGLWWLAQRPDGIERVALEHLRSWRKTRRADAPGS
jgi:lipopolysaccharide exporter